MLRIISTALLSLFGWRVAGQPPTEKKLVIIGAPHTSNWDFPLALLALSSLGLQFSWVGKHTLFRRPFGKLLIKMGGIPVNRNLRNGFLDGIVQAFADREKLIVAIAPEGTRSRTDHWKAGFYHIAVRAGTPVCLGFIDYPGKAVGLGPIVIPTGDIHHDFAAIKEFYLDKSGKYPQKHSEIQLRKKEISLLQKELQKESPGG